MNTATQHPPKPRRRRRDELSTLADQLGVSLDSLKRLQVSWNAEEECWTFPERDGRTKIIGHLRRFRDGRKRTMNSSHRGIYIPSDWLTDAGPLYLPEGATDTAALLTLGLAAIGRPSATGGSDHLATFLAKCDRDVIVVGDNDGGRGQRAAEQLAQRLANAWQRPVGWVLPPQEHKDVRVWLQSVPELDAAAVQEHFEQHVIRAQPSPDEQVETETLALITNVERSLDGKMEVGRRPSEILDDIRNLTGGWPRCVGGRLFVVRGDRPQFLDTTDQFFAWLWSHQCVVTWGHHGRSIGRNEFCDFVRDQVEQFEAIETLPHWPPRPSTYYVHPGLPSPEPGEPSRLDEFLAFFRPARDVDSVALRALLLTLFWGGPPGARPAFLITAQQNDSEQGRGVGKSVLADMLGQLAGGLFDARQNEDVPQIVTRLLTGGNQFRVARIDNVKSRHFSWAAFEGLLTASQISGRRLYAGDAQRPNLLTWILTMNNPSLSKDIAQRCQVIRLARPSNHGNWRRDVEAFIEQHRWDIIRDAGELLQAPIALPQLNHSRWATWESEVLARVTDQPQSYVNEQLHRQGVYDSDQATADLVREKFREKLRLTSRAATTSRRVFIPSANAAEWLNTALGEHYDVRTAVAMLAGLAIPELRQHRLSGARGFLWRAAGVAPNAPIQRLAPTQRL